jgi:hypothetical protein
LIALLLVLLFLSSLAAALSPVQQSGKSVSTTENSTTEAEPVTPSSPPAEVAESRLIRQSVDASRSEPPVIEADVGDQLQLRVTSKESGTVELTGIGPTEDVGPRQPAFFDVLLREDGIYVVRFLGTDREIAHIDVK